MDSSFGASDLGRLIGHDANDGVEFLNYTVDETNSRIAGITIDSNDYIYIAYCYDYSPTGQERTVVQKLDPNNGTADVIWEYRFDDIGMYLPRDAAIKHTENSFYVAFNQRQGGTTVPGIAEFDLDGNLLWKETIDRPGWNLSSGIDAEGDYIYIGLTSYADSSQSQVLCLQPLILLYPDGNEELISGNTETINWVDVNGIDNVKIEFSDNNGVSWTDVNASTENDGSYDWLVPEVTSQNCLVRICTV